MKTLRWSGVVTKQEQKTVQKSKLEGKGKKARRVTIEEDVFLATVKNERDESQVVLRQRFEPFDLVIGEDVAVTIASAQTRLEDAGRRGR